MQDETRFSFNGVTAAIDKGFVHFHYELYHEGKSHQFTETLSFTPPEKEKESPERNRALAAVLNSLHLILGISYWKTYCPKKITITNLSLSERQAQFWNTVYTKGLGELFYKNSIDFRGLVKFPFGNPNVFATTLSQSERAVVLLGAGKDSIVSGELLKVHHKDYAFFALNPTPIHEEIAHRFDLTLYQMERKIDPTLLSLNHMSGVYNGHIPISAVWAFVGVFASLLYDFRYVVASNEESANYGNVSYLGTQINHQWSKSYEFEELFSNYMSDFLVKGITYFSLLRPFTELHITKSFTGYTKYFDVFTSCNTNFKITGNLKRGLWCGRCPKCAFVFLLLGAFLPKETVVSIFQKNLFADHALLPTYKALLGLEAVKPFECVGTPAESRFALWTVMERGTYEADAIIKTLRTLLPIDPREKKALQTSLFVHSNRHGTPKEFQAVLTNI